MNISNKLKQVVKQRADNFFARGDRTDVVGELKTAEENSEELRILCECLNKSIEKCLHTRFANEDKKHRKVPENQVAENLREVVYQLEQTGFDSTLLRSIVGETAALNQLLGSVVVEYEENVEKQILDPLCKLLKDDFPSIAKQRKALKQTGVDLDAAKGRMRNSTGPHAQNQKTETYREELDDAELKFDQTRDLYACDIFAALSQQRNVCSLAYMYLELKREYLQKSILQIDNYLPQIASHIDNSNCSAIYGIQLTEHLRTFKREIALPIELCVKRLIEVGLDEEGLFRVAGSATKVRRLKSAFDANLVTPETLSIASDHDKDYDIHVIAGSLKCYLRELPDPLLTQVLHDQWLEAVRQSDHQARLRSLWTVVNALPPQNRNNLAYLVKFLALLCSHSSVNKMTSNNIAIVIAPNLIWSHRESEDEVIDYSTMGRNMCLGADYRNILEHLIEYSDYFFKENINFGVKIPSVKLPANGVPGQSMTLPRPSHKRNVSNDLNNSTYEKPNVKNCESPKQPQRRKKQAPKPPQNLSCTSLANTSAEDDGTIAGHERNSSSSSPEQSRVQSKDHKDPDEMDSSTEALSSAPSTPNPAPRLHHSSSIRRPTTEPPKPPIIVKPPRPSPPQSDKSVTKNEIGFDQIDKQNPTDVDEEEVVRRPKHDKLKIGFTFDDHEDTKTTSAFRKSLENVIQLQAAGQSVVLPRHHHSSSSSLDNLDDADPSDITDDAFTHVHPKQDMMSKSMTAGIPVLPVPAQRTIIKETALSDKPEPAPRIEKPALPEKPAVLPRPSSHGDSSKPLLPDKPSSIALKASSTSQPSVSSQGVELDSPSGRDSNSDLELQSPSYDDKEGASRNSKKLSWPPSDSSDSTMSDSAHSTQL